MLAISAGFCITRSSLGPHKTVCVSIPLIFFVTSLIADFLLFSQAGLDAFEYKSAASSSVPPDDVVDDYGYYDPEEDPLAGMSPNSSLLFIFATLANTMAFFMAWFYIYDTARSEWQTLQTSAVESGAALPPHGNTMAAVIGGGASAHVYGGSAGGGVDAESGRKGRSLEENGRESTSGVGHSAIPHNAALLEEGENASHLYGDVLGEDLDAPKTVQDRIADRDKVRLMKNFFVAVSAYIMLSLVVFFVPLFVPSAVDAAILIVYDTLLWIFQAGLLVVFRLRNSNQFLLLSEDAAAETTTELGVLYHREDDEGTFTGGSGRKSSKSAAAVGGDEGVSLSWERRRRGASEGVGAPRFTLDDEDQEMGMEKDGEGRRRRSDDEWNSNGAGHGVVVRPIPSDN